MTEQLILQSEGSVFGNFTQSGFAGNAAMFDGNLVNNYPNLGAYHAGGSAYIGKAFPTAKRFAKALIYGWTDRGLIDDGSSGTVYVYGKNGPPLNETDGELLGQTAFTEPGQIAYGAAIEVQSTNRNTTFTHIWARVVGNTTGISGAELVLYEATEAGTQPPPAQTTGRPLAIFLGAGQSNMKGDAPIPSQTTYPRRDRLKMYALDGTIKPAADPLMDTSGSLWAQFNNTSVGCGPLMAFGDDLVAEFKNFDILLVNSSKGSTSIEQWAKGQPLYDGMIVRAKAALAAAPFGSFIAGFVWQQGESNTYDEAGITYWMTAFPQLVANVRADLCLPDLPVVFNGIGQDDSFAPAWKQLRFAQQFMALPHLVKFVKTFDLPNNAGADWTVTSSVQAIGRRAAAAMRSMLPEIL